jgi:uncharacterized damage-inducible protein DinB
MATQTQTAEPVVIISPDAFLAHWQGHRGLTRRMIEAFPDDKLFTYSVGGMRPFSELVIEFLGMGVPTLNGIATGKWETWAAAEGKNKPSNKQELLQAWDETTAEINRVWPTIPPHRWAEVDKAFGQWEGPGYWILFYIVDNEIHHRGQAYVYLRSLGIEPPAFYER